MGKHAKPWLDGIARPGSSRERIEQLEAQVKALKLITTSSWPEDHRLLQAVGDEYPPEAFLYRGGLYRYLLEQ